MFGMFTVKKKDETPADKKLEQIRNILFPPCETRETPNKNGGISKYQVDYSADMNLDSALYDIREGYADGPVQNTIGDVIERLYKVREILEAEVDIDKEAEYIIVDNMKRDFDPEDIVPSEI